MPKSATDVMDEIINAAVIDAALAFKAASGGVANALVRDLGAVHANSTPADLPAPVRDAVAASVRAAFTRLQKEGYAVAPAGGARPTPPPPRPRAATRGPGKPPPKPPIVETKRPPRGPRPPAKPR